MELFSEEWSWLVVMGVWFLLPLLFRLLRRKLKTPGGATDDPESPPFEQPAPGSRSEFDAASDDGAPPPIKPR